MTKISERPTKCDDEASFEMKIFGQPPSFDWFISLFHDLHSELKSKLTKVLCVLLSLVARISSTYCFNIAIYLAGDPVIVAVKALQGDIASAGANSTSEHKALVLTNVLAFVASSKAGASMATDDNDAHDEDPSSATLALAIEEQQDEGFPPSLRTLVDNYYFFEISESVLVREGQECHASETGEIGTPHYWS